MPQRLVPQTTFSHAQVDMRERHTRALLANVSHFHPARASRAREEAIVFNRPLALALARQYSGRGIDDDDLEQVAMLGLCKAVGGYRPQPGKTFAAYAVPTITGELKRHFRDCGWLVRPTRSMQEIGQSIRVAIPTLTQRLHRHPSSADLANFLGIAPGAVEQAMLAEGMYQGWSLDVPVGQTTTLLRDTVPDSRDGFAPVEAALTLGPAVAELAPRERTILSLRFVENQTQEQVGQAIGLSQMQVSRLLTEILAKLRDRIDPATAA